MAEGGLGGGVDLGGIRYSIQLDLTRLQADLDRAEALIRERAGRMGALLGQIEPRAGAQGRQQAAGGTALRSVADRARYSVTQQAIADLQRQAQQAGEEIARSVNSDDTRRLTDPNATGARQSARTGYIDRQGRFQASRVLPGNRPVPGAIIERTDRPGAQYAVTESGGIGESVRARRIGPTGDMQGPARPVSFDREYYQTGTMFGGFSRQSIERRLNIAPEPINPYAEALQVAQVTRQREVMAAVRSQGRPGRSYRFGNAVGQQYEMEVGATGARIRRAEAGEDIGQAEFSRLTRGEAARRLQLERGRGVPISRGAIAQAITGAPQQRTEQEITEAINQSLGPIITRQVGQIQDTLNEAAAQSIQQAAGGGGGGGPPTAEGAEGEEPTGPLGRAEQLALQPTRQDRARARLRGRVIQGLDRGSQVQQTSRRRVRVLQQMRDASEARQQERAEGRTQQRGFGDEQARGEAAAAEAGFPVYSLRTRRPVRAERRTALPLSRFLGAQEPDAADVLPATRYRQSAQLGSLNRAQQQRDRRLAELETQRQERQRVVDTRREMQSGQSRAQREAFVEGRPYSLLGSGRVVNPGALSGAGASAAGGGRGRGALGQIAGLIEPNRDVSALLRVGSAFLGIGLGINVAAGLARQLHQAISDAVTAEVDLERAGRAVTAVMGQQASAAEQVRARVFAVNPQTRGTEAQFLQASAGLQPQVQKGIISDQQRDQILQAGGQLARIHNTELAPAVEALQQVMSGGTDAAEKYGIVLTDQYGRIKGLGLTYQELVDAVGQAQAAQMVLAQAMQQTDQQQQNVSTSTADVATNVDLMNRRWEQLRQNMGRAITGQVNVVVNMITSALGGLNEGVQQQATETQVVKQAEALLKARGWTRNDLGVLTGPGGTTKGGYQAVEQARADAVQRMHEAHEKAAQDAEDARSYAQAQQVATTSSTNAATAAAQVTAQHLQQVTVLDRLNQVLAIYSQRLQATQTIAQALEPYGGVLSMTPQQVEEQARRQAEAAQIQNTRARIAAENPNATPAQLTVLEQQARESAPATDPRVQEALHNQTRIRQAQAALQNATAETSAQQNELQLAQSNREISAANETLGIRRDLVRIDDQRAGLLLSQADLQDRITVASRTNLETEQSVLRARLDELGVVNQLNDIQYGRNEALARVRAYFANQMLGRPQQAIDLNAVVAQVNQSTLEEPQAALDVMHAQRVTELAERPQRQQGLERQMRLNDLDAEQRKLQDQLIPLDALRRAEEARTDAVQRRLQLANLGDEPELNRIRAIANTLQQSGIDADRAMRAAVEQAAGRDPTRDIVGEAIGRAATLPNAARPPQSDVANTVATNALTAAAASMPSIGQIVVQVNGSTNMGPQEMTLAVYAGILQARAHFSGSVAPQTAGSAP